MKEKAQIEKRATRGVKLGNLSENALAKKSISAAIEQEKPAAKKRSQKEHDKELRKHFDKGKAYDEDEDDVADRKNLKEQTEDDKFEAILRDYNNQNKKKRSRGEDKAASLVAAPTDEPRAIPVADQLVEKTVDMPFYKCIQLPEHLKWLNVHGRSSELQLMQEIEALDMEVKRLKEVKALHKEYRRFSCMPIGVMARPC